MFYDELKQKIESLLARRHFQEALDLIEEELKAPYIPRDFEFFLTQNRLIIHEKLHSKSKPKHVAIDSKRIISLLKSKEAHQHLLAIGAFKEINIRLMTTTIQEFLLRSDVANDTKSLVLISLHEQDINQSFKVKHRHEMLNINPKNLNIGQLSSFNQKIVSKLNNIFFQNNQTLNNLAIKISLMFLLDFFPKDFDFAVEDVVAMSLMRATKMLGEKADWSEIKKVLTFDVKKARAIFLLDLPSLD